MDLVSFSIRTKGMRNFARRLGTVFSRFGFSETLTRRALYTVTDLLQTYHGAPTFFIPATVLRRHPELITEINCRGAEIGVHGYVHNDYRALDEDKQYKQTKQAISVFQENQIPYQGFRNPYLGWTEEALRVYTALGFAYESNEAVLHDVIDLDYLPLQLRSSYEKSLVLYRVLSCSAYTLRPHFEGSLLRIPISVPDDEMLFDRLHITNAEQIGRIWSAIMRQIYNLGGLYTLNLHPERADLCKESLRMLLIFARSQPLPVWVARLSEITQWWRERSQFKLTITPLAPERWQLHTECSTRATLLARRLTVEDEPTLSWSDTEVRITAHGCIVQAVCCPCIALSPQTPQEVAHFLHEQGYAIEYFPKDDANMYAFYLDMPEGLGETSETQVERRSSLVQQIEQLDVPLLRFGCWPDGHQAALAISGDIDSVTIQDFFLRILEVR
jgi:peptidoglycan/xylan/chitin deacetylase (PgdA/CDA1 family)